MLLSDPSVGCNLGGQNDKYGRFSQKTNKVRSAIHEKLLSLSLEKSEKKTCGDKLTTLCVICFFDMSRRGKKGI